MTDHSTIPAGHKTEQLTVKLLTEEIEITREEFHRLNELRAPEMRRTTWKGQVTEFVYAPLSQSQEQAIGVLAERIDRLYRFRSLLSAKAYCALDTDTGA